MVQFIRYHFLMITVIFIERSFSDEEVLPDSSKEPPLTDIFGSYSVEKLRDLLEKIDTNKDAQIVKEELINWIVSLSLNELERRARSDINFYDIDKNNKVSWMEMLRTTYGYSEETVEQILKSKDPVDKDAYEFIKEDQVRFLAADSDNDGFLTQSEYKSLLNPSENPTLMKLAIDKIMNKHDKDKDSELNEKEFKLYFYITEDLTETQMKEFMNIFPKYDFDKNGKLSIDELSKWYAPDIKVAADLEANDLMSKSDRNNDQVLTFDEVLSKLDAWKVSQATNYGDHIKDEL